MTSVPPNDFNGYRPKIPETWNNLNIRTEWEQEYKNDYFHHPIASQVHPLGAKTQNATTLSRNHTEEKPRSPDCFSAITQCTQETSFSGFKYIGGSNSGFFRR